MLWVLRGLKVLKDRQAMRVFRDLKAKPGQQVQWARKDHRGRRVPLVLRDLKANPDRQVQWARKDLKVSKVLLARRVPARSP